MTRIHVAEAEGMHWLIQDFQDMRRRAANILDCGRILKRRASCKMNAVISYAMSDLA